MLRYKRAQIVSGGNQAANFFIDGADADDRLRRLADVEQRLLAAAAGAVLSPFDAGHTRVSSGRQTPTSEQRGHLGLSTSGGGIRPLSAVRRA